MIIHCPSKVTVLLILHLTNINIIILFNFKLELVRDSGLNPSQPQHPLFNGLIVDETTAAGVRPIAFATFYYSYSSWEGKTLYLINIFVRAGHRSKGVGRQLFNELMRIVKRTNCHRIEFETNIRNRRAIEFYLELGARNMTATDGWQVFEWEADGTSNAE